VITSFSIVSSSSAADRIVARAAVVSPQITRELYTITNRLGAAIASRRAFALISLKSEV